MRPNSMAAMILAGGRGSRLFELTKKVAKPAVHFGGKYRIIDFPLSNCANSGISTVGVLTQYESVLLNAYVAKDQFWGLNTNNGGVYVLTPREKDQAGLEVYRGTADAITQNIDFLDQIDPEYLLILSGDHIYKMDYEDMLRRHMENQAEATIAVMPVPWEDASRFLCDFPTVWRNLALGYFNVKGRKEEALAALEKAFAMDRSDARVLMELDQLYARLKYPVKKRLTFLLENEETASRRDDLYLMICSLLNMLGRHEEALDRIRARHFHPWEGGEGKVSTQYILALTGMAREAIRKGDAQRAEKLLEKALVFPENLGEGKLEGEKDNQIWYLLGRAQELGGKTQEARESWHRATLGDQEPSGVMFYNDQPSDMIFYQGLAFLSLGEEDEARRRFNRLIDYGEEHLFVHVTIDFFAVSLPDLKIFADDLDARNRIYCRKLIAMGLYGLGRREESRKMLDELKREDPYLTIL